LGLGAGFLIMPGPHQKAAGTGRIIDIDIRFIHRVFQEDFRIVHTEGHIVDHGLLFGILTVVFFLGSNPDQLFQFVQHKWAFYAIIAIFFGCWGNSVSTGKNLFYFWAENYFKRRKGGKT
jgi:hypothetical protein